MTENVVHGTFGRNVLGDRLEAALTGLGGVHPKDQMAAVRAFQQSTVALAKLFDLLPDMQYKVMAEALMDITQYLLHQIQLQDEARKLKNFENSAGQI